VGVVLNTSMNLKDEPLCASPAEAYGVFVRSDLDFLVLERCLVDKRALEHRAEVAR
jgi:carbamoyltransferase